MYCLEDVSEASCLNHARLHVQDFKFPLISKDFYVSLHLSENFGCAWMHASVDSGIRGCEFFLFTSEGLNIVFLFRWYLTPRPGPMDHRTKWTSRKSIC
jgi:hypothetical protein